MEAIYRHTVDRGIKLLGLKREAAEQALARGWDLRGQVHTVLSPVSGEKVLT